MPEAEYLRQRAGRKSPGISNDQIIRLKGIKEPLRLVCYTDPQTGINYCFVSNAHHLKAKEITEIYRECRQIELFFKWIKQNLRIKTFLGTSVNAVLTQIWIALCVYLLVAFLNFKAKLGCSLQQILSLSQLNLFAKRDLIEIFKPHPAASE